MEDPLMFKGGTERVVLGVIDLLSQEGYRVEVIHKENSQKVSGFAPYWVGRQAHLSEKVWDLAVVNNLAGVGFFPGRTKKTVAIFHGLYMDFFGNATKEEDLPKAGMNYWEYLVNKYLNGYLAEAFVLNSADRVVAVSQSLKEAIQKHTDRDVMVIHNPVDPIFRPMDKRRLREMYNIPKDALVGLFVGRNDYAKGYDIFRELVSYTYRDILWVQVLSGGGLASSVPLMKEIITFRGVPFEEMPTIYNLADFLVFPSRYEGFGLSIVEALACGIPVITSKVGVAGELCDILNGFLVAELNAEEFLKRIEVIKKYKVIRDHYREYISEEVHRRFSIELWKERMREALLS